MKFLVDDVFTMEERDGFKLISFVVGCDPPSQERPRMALRGRTVPVMYDPSSALKRELKKALQDALVDGGYVTTTPYFKQDRAYIRVDLDFFFQKQQKKQSFLQLFQH